MQEPLADAAAFGRRLRHARLDRGLSQSGLASGLCSASAISRWESGHNLPPTDILLGLARRLDIDVHLLTGSGFDSRLAESTEGFAALLHLALGDTPGTALSPMASWIARARHALREAEPWIPGSAQNLIDDLSLDPLASSAPAALETIEILNALVAVGEEPGANSITELINVLTWTTDAPEHLRRSALEIAVALLVMKRMPVAARGAVIKVAPQSISEATRILLTWDTPASKHYGEAPLPPIHPHPTARDVAFRLFARLHAQGASPVQAASTAATLLPEDALLTEWEALLRHSPTLF